MPREANVLSAAECKKGSRTHNRVFWCSNNVLPNQSGLTVARNNSRWRYPREDLVGDSNSHTARRLPQPTVTEAFWIKVVDKLLNPHKISHIFILFDMRNT